MEPAPDEETAAHRQGDAVDVPIETPAEDVAEQAMQAVPSEASDDDETVDAVLERGLEVDEADAAEQARVAGLDDEYR